MNICQFVFLVAMLLPSKVYAKELKTSRRTCNRKPAAEEGQPFCKGSNCILRRQGWVLCLKSFSKSFQKRLFLKAERLPPARCTAKNYKPAGGNAIEHQQLGQDCFLAKGSNCIHGKAKVVSLGKNPYPKALKNRFFKAARLPPSKVHSKQL